MNLFGRKDRLEADLDRLDDDELERMAHDVGLSVGDLRALAKRTAGSDGELLLRMADIGLDSKEVSAAEPAVFRDLQRVCSLCASKGQCDHDLLEGHTDIPDYCPNRDTLRALVEERQEH